jgi:putative transposase
VPGVRVWRTLSIARSSPRRPTGCGSRDITYLRTWEGWLYLVAVQDVFSRRIVGWSMADHMRTELVTDAPEMALAQRRRQPGLIWDSDQGSQLVSLALGQRARAPHRPIDGQQGRPLRQRGRRELLHVKKELIHGRSWPTKAELRTNVFEYIEVVLDRRRRHSALGFLSPEQFETTRQKET